MRNSVNTYKDDPKQISNEIIFSPLVQEHIKGIMEAKGAKSRDAQKADLTKLQKKLYAQASSHIDELCCNFGQSQVRWMMLLMQRSWRKMYDQLIINQNKFQLIKKMVNNENCSVVYLPNHRSHTDYLLMTYLHFFYSLKLPYVCATDAFLNITFLTKILRKSGGFFVNRDKLKDPLY